MKLSIRARASVCAIAIATTPACMSVQSVATDQDQSFVVADRHVQEIADLKTSTAVRSAVEHIVAL
ncbi:MAG: hypothetical protein OEM51_06685, partial [Gammaproteobacteria bacterium]|nr:hypothetical protein [Gammaproteobacteria bacterium]